MAHIMMPPAALPFVRSCRDATAGGPAHQQAVLARAGAGVYPRSVSPRQSRYVLLPLLSLLSLLGCDSGGAARDAGIPTAMAGDGDGDSSGTGGGTGPGERDAGDGADAGHRDIRDAGSPDAGGHASDACAPSTAPDGTNYVADWASGSRIQARYLRAAGMPDVFYGFYDAQLGVACDFLTASDGLLRCLPRQASLSVFIGYADAACERRVVDGPAACDGAGYLRRMDACGERTAVHRLAAPAATTPVYRGGAGDCVASGETLQPAPGLLVAGAALEPAVFVAGTRATLPGACRSALQVVETADGARGPIGLGDVAHELDCRVPSGQPGQGAACAPARLAYATPNLFSDAACTAPAEYASWSRGPDCAPPELLSGDDAADYYAVAGVAADPVFGGNPCEPARDKPWVGTLFSRGAPVIADAFAQFDVALAGTGRLRAYRVDEAGVRLLTRAHLLPDAGFYDSQRDAGCTVFRFDDGTHRCVVTTSGPEIDGPLYDDDACTLPAVACSDDCPGKHFVSAVVDASACATEVLATGVWSATGMTADDQAYFDRGAGCEGIGLSGTAPWLADAVDLSSLPALELHVAD